MSYCFTVYLLLILGADPQSVCLEYRTTQPNLPGQLGSISYQTIWIGEDILRIDFDTNESKIIDLTQEKQIELDHLVKEFRVSQIEPQEPGPPMSFERRRSEVTWESLVCDIYAAVVEDGTEIEIWFGRINGVPSDMLMKLLIGYEADHTQFPTGPPKGFPVRVIIRNSVEYESRQSLDLSLLKSTRQIAPPDHFQVPPNYRERSP